MIFGSKKERLGFVGSVNSPKIIYIPKSELKENCRKFRIKRGQKYFQKSKMDKKNVQFSKTEILYEKGVKIPPFLALWSGAPKKSSKICYANFKVFLRKKI
uniref:Uncharacterized protein n=1 Tax=viral metagenome TaxID=1070528 RepID=A0A6C0K2Z3_9ZZZZ